MSSSLTKVALQKFYLLACNKYYLISFSCTILLFTNFNFSYSWALQYYMQKWPVFMCNIMKKFLLNFCNHVKLCVKKIINFEWMHNFVQNWFRIDTKMMPNFMQKSHFVENHATVVQENWLFHGNLNCIIIRVVNHFFLNDG